MTASRGAARRYARALFDVARDGADPAAVRADLARFRDLLAENRPLRVLLANPAVPARVKKPILAGLRERVGWSDLVARLLDLLVERGRTPLVPALARSFAELWNDAQGVVAAEAVTARPLPDEQREALSRAIVAVTGRQADLSEQLDPAVIGGVVLRMAGRTYDGSVCSQLRALRRELAEGRPA